MVPPITAATEMGAIPIITDPTTAAMMSAASGALRVSGGS